MFIEFELPGVIISKKNGKRIVTNRKTKKPMVISSAEFKAWEKVARLITNRIKADYQKCFEKVASIGITIYYPDLIRRDLTNQAESIMDLLVDSGIIKDDSWRVVPEVVLKGHLDRKNPRALIRIEE